jgi:3-hydroxyacyl-[acyl-carrier-protein] dehydratase
MRFHLLDRIEEICYGHYITAVKCITLADDVFDEHFPGYPVFPGSLILEGLAQLGGSFFELMMDHQNLPVKRSILSIVNKLKLRRPVFPGDKLVYRADLVTMREEYGVVKVRAEIEGECCAEGELTFTFVDIPDDTLHQSRLELYKICMKNTKVIEES